MAQAVPAACGLKAWLAAQRAFNLEEQASCPLLALYQTVFFGVPTLSICLRQSRYLQPFDG